MTTPAAPDLVQQVPACPVPRQPDQGRQFLTSHPLRRLDVDGAPGFAITVRMPSYRSLPLSCIVRIHIMVDHTEVDADRLRLRLAGLTYRIEDLATRAHQVWFVLDTAEVLVAQPLGDAADYQIDLAFVTVEPYVTNGRFHRTKRASGRLPVGPDWSAR